VDLNDCDDSHSLMQCVPCEFRPTSSQLASYDEESNYVLEGRQYPGICVTCGTNKNNYIIYIYIYIYIMCFLINVIHKICMTV